MSLGLKSTFEGALASGRKNEPLSQERVRAFLRGRRVAGSAHWMALDASDFFRAMAARAGKEFSAIVLEYFGAVAARLAEPERIVVGYMLGTEREGLSPAQDSLEARRKAAMRKLASLDLHGSLIRSLPNSVSAYRTNVEERVLVKFADMLDNPDADDCRALGLDVDHFAAWITTGRPRARRVGRVVVVGGAVMDINFRIPRVPEVDSSVQALSYKLFPGGKGLTQAVGAARLGLETSLISVVGDDDHGNRILRFLSDEGVDVSLVEQRKSRDSPVTGVITLEHSGTFAIGWKNEGNLFLGPEVLDRPKYAERLHAADYVLASFELPATTIAAALVSAKDSGATTIVTPAPPYSDHFVDPDVYKCIDYLVANIWELTEFTRRREPLPEESDLVQELAVPLIENSELRNVLVVHQQQCHAFLSSSDKRRRRPSVGIVEVAAWPGKLRESAGDRDAFCAMLAYKLHDLANDDAEVAQAIYWATAAMAKAGGRLSVPDSMPRLPDVEALVESGKVLLPDMSLHEKGPTR